jgi:hypothetical protein
MPYVAQAYVCAPKGYGQASGPIRPQDQGVTLADKSPRQTLAKKSGKTLKEKRADKHAKAASRASSTEVLLHDKKR